MGVTTRHLGFSVALTLAVACALPPSNDDWLKGGITPDDSHDAGDTHDASGADDAGGDGGGPQVCDPVVDASCIDPNRGVFVRAGALAGDGSKNLPFGSIGAALLSRGDKTQIFVCAGTYAENVKVHNAQVSIVGGLRCNDFTPGAEATVIAPAAGIPLDVQGASEVALVGLTARAADATEPSGSSVALWVHEGAKVTAQRSVLEAGKGANGANADPAAQGAAGGKGGDGTVGPGSVGTSECGNVGGKGGKGEAGSAGNATHGTPAPSPPASGAPGLRGCNYDETAASGCNYDATQECGSGVPGSGGKGAIAAEEVIVVGELTASGWVSGTGSTGRVGEGGGGGGGGGQGEKVGAHGGGGGGGGCGGPGGSGGSGGGASLAVMVYNASFSATSTMLFAKDGGNGGNGSKGGNGGNGGGSGARGTHQEGPSNNPIYYYGCAGGVGGGGGGGSGGQGGPSGLSAGIAFDSASSVKWENASISATTPTLAGITIGSPAQAGRSGEPGGGGEASTAASKGKPAEPSPAGHVTAPVAAWTGP